MNEFELHYQPRVELGSGRATSVEALIRWRRGEKGLVLPASFIPLAEETGLIIPIGEWVLRTACAQMRRWAEDGHDEMRVAVNLSPRQFRQTDLVDTIRAILRETGADARHLELEITESIAMHDPESSRKCLESLSALGIALAIDDFGTGYSSLAYLKRFPIDNLKIDQSFVQGVPADEDDINIVRSIIALGRSLGLTVIAEGVETEEQRSFLRDAGCDEMQGYLHSRPQAKPQLDEVVRPAPTISVAG
jgi:EAL domain-containing protein (putative c-di-GMP-specific phosphodiesterase class I)